MDNYNTETVEHSKSSSIMQDDFEVIEDKIIESIKEEMIEQIKECSILKKQNICKRIGNFIVHLFSFNKTKTL